MVAGPSTDSEGIHYLGRYLLHTVQVIPTTNTEYGVNAWTDPCSRRDIVRQNKFTACLRRPSATRVCGQLRRGGARNLEIRYLIRPGRRLALPMAQCRSAPRVHARNRELEKAGRLGAVQRGQRVPRGGYEPHCLPTPPLCAGEPGAEPKLRILAHDHSIPSSHISISASAVNGRRHTARTPSVTSMVERWRDSGSRLGVSRPGRGGARREQRSRRAEAH